MIRTLCVQLVAVLLLLIGMGHTVQAQISYTLTIREGQVYLDGKQLSTDDLPASLDIEGVSAQLTFVGETVPVIEIGGSFFAIENGALRLIDADEESGDEGVTVFFREEPAPVAPALSLREHNMGVSAIGVGPAQAYQARARAADERRVTELIQGARLQADEAQRVVQVMPRLEVKSYLSDIQQQNQVLYQRLVQEWQLEAEVQNRAFQLQGRSKEEIEPHLEDLRTLLDAIFEMKQENRRYEIEQFEQQLAELRQRLEKRESMRNFLIERRLQELLGVEIANW